MNIIQPQQKPKKKSANWWKGLEYVYLVDDFKIFRKRK